MAALRPRNRETEWLDIYMVFLHRRRHLTSTLPAVIMIVAHVSFRSCPPVAPKEPVGRNHEGDVSVYSLYKETRSSDDRGVRERHYAGWVADQDDAIRRANEIYEGRDSTKAVLVLGNGRTGVEVVYRVGDEN